MMEQEGILSKTWRNIRQTVRLYNARDIIHLMKVENTNQRMGFPQRSLISDETLLRMVDGILDHPYNYKVFRAYGESHEAMRMIFERIILESLKNGVEIKRKFAFKCEKCGTEYQRPTDTCSAKFGEEKCDGKLREPNPDERMTLTIFMRDPNPEDELTDILTSLLADGLPLGNAYLYKRHLKMGDVETPETVVYVEDTQFIHIATDHAHRLGNHRFFCPICYEGRTIRTADGNIVDTYMRVYHEQEARELGFKCDKCGKRIYEVAYVQDINGRMTALWHKDEMVHFNFFPRLPKKEGRSPMIALLMALRTSLAMSKNNFANYQLGRLAKLIVLKGNDQNEANLIAGAIRENLELEVTRARIIGKTVNLLRTLFIGGRKGVEVHDAMPDPQKMQSLEWANYYIAQVMAPMFFLQPVMVNARLEGGGGYFKRMEIVINNDGIRKWQGILEAGWNQQVLPFMGVYDWELKFGELEKKDKRLDAQMWKEMLTAGQLAAQMGLPASITDEGELKVGSGEIEKIEGWSGKSPNTPTEPNLPEDEKEPRQAGDTGINPGADQGAQE